MSSGLKITGIGRYLPTHAVPSHEIDARLGKAAGWVEQTYGIHTRYFADEHETTSFMAMKAARLALEDANMDAGDLDCIIAACAVMQQAMPGTGPLLQKELGLEKSGCAAFDVNSSCLSFLTALDIAHLYIQSGRYKNILIASSDIPSVGLDWNEPDICTSFGDGAAAVIVSAAAQNSVKSTRMETFSEGFDFCQIPAGGTKLHPSRFQEDLLPHALFQMDGKAAFRLTNKIIQPFLDRLLKSANLMMSDIELLIPHQASASALNHMRNKLDMTPERFFNIYAAHGNQVAASLPTALYEAITSERLQRGDKVLLLGTAAGLSIGGMILEY